MLLTVLRSIDMTIHTLTIEVNELIPKCSVYIKDYFMNK